MPPSNALLDAVRSLSAVAADLGDAQSEDLARELAEQMPRQTLNLIVAGQFKRGKSSLVNAFLGDDLMPTGALPLTGVATAIRHGEVVSVQVRRRGEERPCSVAPEDLAKYVTERFNPGNALGVERVDVRWPSERLRGLVLFDTPGVGSVYEHNTAAAFAALPRADAAILVVGPEPPVSLEELEYAREILASSEKLFVVLNKSDLAGDSLGEIMEFTRGALSRVLARDVQVLPVSATRARAEQRAAREDAEFARLDAMLRAFVADRGVETLNASLRRRALRIVERLDVLASLRLSTLRLPSEERRLRRVAVEEALQVVDDRARPLELAIDDDVSRLQLRLEDRLDRMRDRDLPSFCANADRLAALPRTAREKLFGEVLGAVVAAWRTEARAQADSDLRIFADKYARLAAEIERLVWKAGLEAASLDAGAIAPGDIVFAPANLMLVASLVPTTGLELLIGLAIDVLPAALRRRVLRPRYDRMLAGELDAAKGKLRYCVARELDPWRRNVRDTISSSLGQARAVVLAAFEEPIRERGEGERAVQMEEVRRCLDALRASIGAADVVAAESAT